jgi:hypothetical protein
MIDMTLIKTSLRIVGLVCREVFSGLMVRLVLGWRDVLFFVNCCLRLALLVELSLVWRPDSLMFGVVRP